MTQGNIKLDLLDDDYLSFETIKTGGSGTVAQADALEPSLQPPVTGSFGRVDLVLGAPDGDMSASPTAATNSSQPSPSVFNAATFNAAAFGSIATIGNYIATTSPSSSQGAHWAAGSTVNVDLSGLLLAGELLYARTALAAWARVANIHFAEVGAGSGQITITDGNDPTNYVAGTSPIWSGTTLTSASIEISQKWYNNNGGYGGTTGILNSYGYQTYFHELGHALGLGHVGPYNGTAIYGSSDPTLGNIFTNDSWQFSVMSYFDQTNYGGASFAFVTNAMQADVYGIQLLYGAATSSATHWFGYNPASAQGPETDLAQSDSFTMWTADGIAYLDASNYSGTQTVNFDAGSFSSLKGLTNNVGLALNTHLEAYIGGSGTDIVHTGTSANGFRNIFTGAGNDYIYSEGSGTNHNTIDGGTGFDTVDETTSSASFTFKHVNQSSNGWTVVGSGTFDNLTNVEQVVFTDQTVTLRQAKSDFNFGAVGDAGATSDLLLQSGSSVVDWSVQNSVVTTGALLGSSSGYSVVATGDVNGDGISDIILQIGGTVVDWIMKNGVIQGTNVITTGAVGWSVVGTGDFNNDGTQDLILQNGGAVAEWNMSNGAFLSGSLLGVNSGWSVVGTGDFNGDGTTDILLQNGGSIVEWYMTNGLVTGGKQMTGNAAGWSVVGTGDFNGDGTADVLVRNGAGLLVDWLVQGGTVVAGTAIGSAPGWTVVGTGDYNGDGTADIALQNGGSVVDWVMSNGSYSSGHLISTGAGGFTVRS